MSRRPCDVFTIPPPFLTSQHLSQNDFKILKSFSNIPPFTYLPENVNCRREMNGVSEGG